MKSNFSVIETKLNDFIRKFYSNRIVIGAILFVLIAVVSLFSVFMIESFAYMPPNVKTILFYFLVFLFISIFVFFIVIPVCKIFKLIPFLSYEEASNIISNYFTESKDLLINILQLNQGGEGDLLIASINQKIEKISPLNFTNAINFKKTFRFLIVSLSVVLFLCFLSWIFNRKIMSGADRFMNYSTFYQPENPYELQLLNKDLSCPFGEDYEVRIQIDGPSVPSDVFLRNSLFNIRMNYDSSGYYSCILKNLSDDIKFSFDYLGYSSSEYQLKVFRMPQVLKTAMTITPPSYTGEDVVYSESLGDVTVPSGSEIMFSFSEFSNSTAFDFFIDSSSVEVLRAVEDRKIIKKALKSFDYFYLLKGENNTEVSSNMFHVNLIPDYFPQIQVVSAVDSSTANAVFFSGRISDDYGFHSLEFKYFDSNSPKEVKSQKIDIANSVAQEFYFYFDFNNLPKSVSYYFEVRDNDNISGFKSTKTPLSVYTTISNEEKQVRIDNLNSSIFDKIDQSQRLLRELNRDLDDFQKNVSSNSNMSDYEKKLKLDNLLEKRNKLESLLNDLSQENQSKNAFENQLNQKDIEELAKKQAELQKMWDDLLTDDIKELLDKINEMANSLNEKNLRENIQDLKFDFDQIQQQLDRNSELMKMYNIDNRLQNLSLDLKQLSEDYKDLSDQLNDKDNKMSKDSKGGKDNQKHKDSKSDKNMDSKSDNKSGNANFDNESLQKKMDELKEAFDKKYKEYTDLQKQNEELGENKLEIKNLQKEFDDVKDKIEYQKNELDDITGNKDNVSRETQKESQNSDKDSQRNDSQKSGNNASDKQNQFSDNKQNLYDSDSEKSSEKFDINSNSVKQNSDDKSVQDSKNSDKKESGGENDKDSKEKSSNNSSESSNNPSGSDKKSSDSQLNRDNKQNKNGMNSDSSNSQDGKNDKDSDVKSSDQTESDNKNASDNKNGQQNLSDNNDSKNKNQTNKSDQNRVGGDKNQSSDSKNNQNSDRQESQNGQQKQQNGQQNNQNGGQNNENDRKRRENLSQQMEETAEEIEQLSDKLQGMEKQNKEKKNKENLNDVRQILDNLVSVSFSQEGLISQLKKNSSSVFMSTDLLRQQIAVQKDFALVQDSIYALAKRTPQLGHAVYEKLDNIHDYFGKITTSIDNNRRQEVMTNQQHLLQNVNDLAVIFDEIQQNMQKQQQQNGQQSDEEEQQNTSRNKKEMQQRQQNTQQMKSQQQTLKENLQKMLQQLQQGEKPSSQQLAEQLKRQEMMMKQLQEMQNGKGLSPEEQKLMNGLQQMFEQNKRDIINRKIDRNLINRQDQIFDKLLQLENAEKQQDRDEKRESQQGSDFQKNNQQNLNLKLKDFGAKEFINSSPVNLNLFYQNKYNEFIQNIE